MIRVIGTGDPDGYLRARTCQPANIQGWSTPHSVSWSVVIPLGCGFLLREVVRRQVQPLHVVAAFGVAAALVGYGVWHASAPPVHAAAVTPATTATPEPNTVDLKD